MRLSASSLCALCILTCLFRGLAIILDEPRSRAEAQVKDSDNNLPIASVSPNAAHYPSDYEGEEVEDEYISPHMYGQCCPLAPQVECRAACMAALKTPREIGITHVMDTLQRAGCDMLLHDPLTQCFMTSSAPRKDSAVGLIGQDAAKLHCCELARAPHCRRLCHRAFSNDWAAAASELHEHCLVNVNETSFSSCIDEVDFPCSPRCSGQSFCAPVTDSLGSWFRSCSAEADAAARMDVARWERDGVVRLSEPMPVPVARMPPAACHPDLWRTLACLLHSRPCHPRAGSLGPCLSDCIALVTQCVDWLQVVPGFSARAICNGLTDTSTCVPVSSLLSRSVSAATPFLTTAERFGSPTITAAAPSGSTPASCALGDVSAVTVTIGTAVRLAGNGSSSCPQACVCGAHGLLERCVALPCSNREHCHVGIGMGIEPVKSRKTVFRDCMVCSCTAGKLLCGQRRGASCGVTADDTPSWCRCPSHYLPVCGRNGRTYRNPCLAACAGLSDSDTRPGACSATNPCAGTPSPCPVGSACVPARSVCLSLQQRSCPQHQCVPLTKCSRDREPACDTMGTQHLNPCSLLKAGRSLAHHGSCIPQQQSDEGGKHPVCGADGETYSSAAAAMAARVPEDYLGPCGGCELPGAVCAPLPAGCSGVRLPGACCPSCGPALLGVLAAKELDRAVLTLTATQTAPWANMEHTFTLTKLLDDLQQVVLEDGCRVEGYLTQNDEVVVVLRHVTGSAVSAECASEALRLAGLFEQSGARLQTHLLLSAVVAVDVLLDPSDSGVALTAPSWDYNVAVFVGAALVIVAPR